VGEHTHQFLIMANTLELALVWGCLPYAERRAIYRMVETYPLPNFDSVTRFLVSRRFQGEYDYPFWMIRQLAFEQYTGVIIQGEEEGDPESGYYSKASGIFPQINLCVMTGNCLLNAPYTAPLNFINNPDYQIPPP